MRKLLMVIAAALAVIAANLTYMNIQDNWKSMQADKVSADTVREEVVEVVGRAWITFDGLGADGGLVVRENDGLRIVKYSEIVGQTGLGVGTGFKPNHLLKATIGGDKAYYADLIVQNE